MPGFTSFDGTRLHYEAAGDGHPVVLLHGFAADAEANWVRPGILSGLTGAGRGVIALDARGHGRSDKPYDPAAYGNDAMVKDVQALFDHVGLVDPDVIGYSMGSMTTARLAAVDPRPRSIVLGGVGGGLARPRPVEGAAAIADGLLADDPKSVADPVARAFRRFADSTGADRRALAAIQRSTRFTGDIDLGAIGVPALVITGDADALVGSPEKLAGMIPGAEFRVVSGDHLTAVADPAFTRAILEFLEIVDARRTGAASG